MARRLEPASWWQEVSPMALLAWSQAPSLSYYRPVHRLEAEHRHHTQQEQEP